MKVPLNKEEYSAESKRSIGHKYLGDEYKDIKYNCSKCKKKTVFPAIGQKDFCAIYAGEKCAL